MQSATAIKDLLADRAKWQKHRPDEDDDELRPFSPRQAHIVPVGIICLKGCCDYCDVRFGSLADVCSAKRYVHFAPESPLIRRFSTCSVFLKLLMLGLFRDINLTIDTPSVPAL